MRMRMRVRVRVRVHVRVHIHIRIRIRVRVRVHVHVHVHYVLAYVCNGYFHFYSIVSLQNESASDDRAHRFSSILFRRSNKAFDVLQIALEKTGQKHIKDELQRIQADQ